MLQAVVRFAKRFAVLVPGLIVAYLSVFDVFPLLHGHLPAVLAAIATYALAAYVLIPAILRIVRMLFPPKHLPLYCITPDGFASDPLNIGLIGTREELRAAMAAAGWHTADKLSIKTGIRIMLSTIYGWSYPTAPFGTLYLFGRKQDEAFQLPIDEGHAGSRHHVRFWATTFKDDKKLTTRSIDWQHREAHLRQDQLLWVGAASRDIGVTFIRHTAQLTHLVDPDTNQERELLTEHLVTAKAAQLERTITLRSPYRVANLRGWYGHLHSDGKMKILRLSQDLATSLDAPKRPRQSRR